MDEPTTEKKQRRSRRVASSPSNVLGKCIEEMGRLAHAERSRVMAALRAWFEEGE